MGAIHCGRCGSRRIRRSHTPPGWPQLVHRWTPLRWYACGTCGYHGWTLHQFHGSDPGSARTQATSRPLEARDLRHRYARRRGVVRVVVIATALGVAAGYLILRGGG
jgi:hypothetical protein